MPVRSPDTTVVALPPKPRSRTPLLFAVTVAAIWWALDTVNLDTTLVRSAPHDIIEYLGRFTQPSLVGLNQVPLLLAQTVLIAVWGTLLALLIGIVAAPLAATGHAPSRLLQMAVRQTLSLLRTVPDMVLALVLAVGFGFGPLPGILALGLHTGGFLGKFFAESLERVDPRTTEGVIATGATRLQVLFLAGWPSVGREVIGYGLYVLDRNVRVACVLGIVGAGGIGILLQQTLKLYNYPGAAAIIGLMAAILVVIDSASTALRRRLR